MVRAICFSLICTISQQQAESQPPRVFKGIKNVELYEYQKEGINWILDRYDNGLSTILGKPWHKDQHSPCRRRWYYPVEVSTDLVEMGLGKTLQSITTMAYLWKVKRVSPPYRIL